MNMKYLYRLMFLFGFILTFSQCTEEVKPKPLTYTQLLTGKESKAWRLTSIRLFDDGQDSGPVSVRQVYPNCIADDEYVFYANDVKTFEIREGASKCNADNSDVFLQHNWSLVNATSTLTFVVPFITTEFALPFTVKSLTEKNLVVEFYAADVNLSFRFTFTAQNG